MATDPMALAALLASGVTAVSVYVTSKAAKSKVDQDAVRAAQDYMRGTLEEYRIELKETKALRKELEVELKEAIAARERAEDKSEMLGIRVATLELDMKKADGKIRQLEDLLKKNQVEIPPEESI